MKKLIFLSLFLLVPLSAFAISITPTRIVDNSEDIVITCDSNTDHFYLIYDQNGNFLDGNGSDCPGYNPERWYFESEDGFGALVSGYGGGVAYDPPPNGVWTLVEFDSSIKDDGAFALANPTLSTVEGDPAFISKVSFIVSLPIIGFGTIDRLTKFTAIRTLNDSLFSDDGVNITLTSGNLFMPVSSIIDSLISGVLNFGTATATTMTFGRSGQNMIINSKVGIGTSTPLADLDLNGSLSANAVKTGAISTASNCNSVASPAVCASASAGSVAMPTGGDTLEVDTSAVTADSQIFINEDSSLNSRLGITCNTDTGRTYSISARSSGTSFTIKSSANPDTNKACLSYFIVN